MATPTYHENYEALVQYLKSQLPQLSLQSNKETKAVEEKDAPVKPIKTPKIKTAGRPDVPPPADQSIKVTISTFNDKLVQAIKAGVSQSSWSVPLSFRAANAFDMTMFTSEGEQLTMRVKFPKRLGNQMDKLTTVWPTVQLSRYSSIGAGLGSEEEGYVGDHEATFVLSPARCKPTVNPADADPFKTAQETFLEELVALYTAAIQYKVAFPIGCRCGKHKIPSFEGEKTCATLADAMDRASAYIRL